MGCELQRTFAASEYIGLRDLGQDVLGAPAANERPLVLDVYDVLCRPLRSSVLGTGG